jgi:tetratricopeptide (TPR) repeat protein
MENYHPLRVVREHFNLSIRALASETSLSARTIIRAEQGLAIYPSSRSLICDYFSEKLGRTVRPVELGLLPEQADTIAEQTEIIDMNKARRDLLLQALGIAGASLFLPIETLERIGRAATQPSAMDVASLEEVARINETCWRITNGSETAMIDQIIWDYLPGLATVAQHPFKEQELAANLAAQGYLLAGLVALDRLDFPAMERYSQLAVEHSQLAKDHNLHAAALKQQATMFLIAKEPYKALQTYQKALPFIKLISPLLRSRVYQGLANASARCGLEVDALRYLGQAYETFPDDFERDPSFLYADSGLSVLYMYDGLVRLDLDQPKQAWDAFAKVDGLHPKIVIGELTQLEFMNLQAKAAVAMRNQELSRQYIEAAAARADALKCRWGRTEAFEIYQQARLVWAGEPQIKTLGQLFR